MNIFEKIIKNIFKIFFTILIINITFLIFIGFYLSFFGEPKFVTKEFILFFEIFVIFNAFYNITKN